MAKLTGPLLSFGGSGQIGKTMVVSKWRGIPYARQHVIPANPKTAAQQAVRTLFAFLREVWKMAPSQNIAAWDAFAQGRPFTGMNKEVGENVRVLNGEANLTNYIFSPGAKGGPAALAMTAVTGGAAGEIDWTADAPPTPNGWTLTKMVVSAIHQQNPTGIFDSQIVAAEDAVAPYAGTLTGLMHGENYVVGVWPVWTKPDGTLAYGVSISTVAAAHA